MAEVIPPPLDAYQTAKPAEPTWTVQGGDPLGAPLLRIWAIFARIQAGVVKGGETDYLFRSILKAANKNPPENDRERDELLIRASKTEEVSWDMDAYRAGQTTAEGQNAPAENSSGLDVNRRLDQHDRRVRAAQTINNMVAELADIIDDLGGTGYQFLDEEQCADMITLVDELKAWSEQIEPRRLFKRS